MNFILVFLYVSTPLILQINGVEESKLKLSREDVIEIEKQIQFQKNHTVKTIRTRHGDQYDCVDYYKQPSFNQPLSKSLTFIPKKKQTLSHEIARNKASSVITPQKVGGCPDGTIPIKRVTKEDRIRVELAQRNDDKPFGTLNAKCSTQETKGYTGVSATIVAYNPEVRSNQYSAAVMKLHFGPESIEAGWRVDPQLYGDMKTRLYIHTNTRDAKCFNTLCHGFVITNKLIPLGLVFDKVSTPGGERYGIDISITIDGAGRWRLRVTGGVEIGYWPVALFEHPGSADYVEWGGEVFSPVGWKHPGMGSGRVVIEDTSNDAYFSNVKVKKGSTSDVPSIDPSNLICKGVTRMYVAVDEGNVGDGLQFLIFYGGPPSNQ